MSCHKDNLDSITAHSVKSMNMKWMYHFFNIMETNAETSSADNVNTNNISSQDTNESTTTSINTESKTAQELRNRKTKSTPTTPATQSKDETSNGGEFYDCNIW